MGTLAFAMLLGACAGSGPRASVPALPPLLNPSHPEMNQVAPDTFKVLFETTQGDFMVEAIREWAPAGADRFFNLVSQGFYDDARFFRVLPGFVAQFGIHWHPDIARVWKEARVTDDSVQVSNLRGRMTFAMSGADSRTTQLFINLADNARLDGMGFAPFARLTGGMEVVDRFYSGYGEGAPRGRGPDQGRIFEEGDAYLASDFPLLDRVVRARILAP